MAEPLSPQAQAVRHAAICAGPELEGRIAAALQAVADQIVPEVPLNLNARGTRHWHRAIRDNEIRILITAIATELEAKSND